jgi:acyl carrier protein
MIITEKDLKKIISKALNIKESQVKDNLKSSDIEEWDSLGHLSIISSLDKKLKNKIDISKLNNIDSYGKIKNFLKKNSVMK